MDQFDSSCCGQATSKDPGAAESKPDSGTPLKVYSGPAPTAAPVACDLQVFEGSERLNHGNLFERLVIGRAIGLRELNDGYAIQFPCEPPLFAALASWIASESRCCPFFTFELRLEPEGGAIWMTMQGPKGVKAMLGPQLSRIRAASGA